MSFLHLREPEIKPSDLVPHLYFSMIVTIRFQLDRFMILIDLHKGEIQFL